MTALALDCSGVAVRVGETTVLRDLDLHVAAGTLTTVVGPSGAGKTTLLRVVAGLERLSAGDIRLGACNLGPLPSHRRRLAVVFQEPRLFPNLTVGENVAFPLRMAGVRRAARNSKARRLLDEVGLAGIAERAVRGLSGGEQQRVALARALAANPDLLLLDEPLSAVDPNRREDLRHLIAVVQRERDVTTLYVTHDRAEAAELGDQVALLIEGRVLQHAPPEELFERPSTPVVARFFGATNVLSGWVTAGRFRSGGVDVPVSASDGTATVVIRPERLSLSERGPVAGDIVASSYQGSHRRVVVDCAGTVVEAHVDPAVPVAAGARVRLDVAAQHVWPLPSAADRSRRR